MSRAMLKQMKMTRTKVEQQLLGEEVSLRSTLRNQRRASRKRLGRKRRKQPMEPLHPHQGDTQELLYQEALTKWCFSVTWTRLSVVRSLMRCSRLLLDPGTRS